MASTAPAPITVCVPAYNAASFIENTLSRVSEQSHPDMRVLISVDLSTDDTVARCKKFEQDTRFRVVAHTARRNWIDNINGMLELVETDDYCVLPHDDLIDADYLMALQTALDANERATVAFTDIVAFGELKGAVSQPSIGGDLFDRVMIFLTDHFDAVAFRGVVRQSRAGSNLRLRSNPFSGFAADTLWMLQVLVHGEMLRVPGRPGMQYHKFYRIGSQHHQWLKWDRELRTEAWIEHCALCAELALGLPFTPAEKRLIVHAVMQRSIKRFRKMGWPPFIGDLTDAHQALIQSCLTARLAGVPGRGPGTLAKVREMPRYQEIAKRLWGKPDSDSIGRGGTNPTEGVKTG
jgi:glycosyltransferase involved in cell wall biosynthesis